MNRHMLEHHHLQQDGDGHLLLPHGFTKDHRKLAVEAFLDRLGIPHLKEKVHTELPFKQVERPEGKRRQWLYGLIGVMFGIGMAMSWIKWVNLPKTATYSMSSFIADYGWEGFRRVMPVRF